MADDITLTVRVRDMTRGEFADIRRRMHGMDGDIRGLAQSSNLASDRADRLGQSIRGVAGRLGQMQRAGSLAGHEMDYMRRSMGLLSRDLRMAARAGELTEDEFRNLRDELDETRLGFDRLDNEIRRHNAVAQRSARDAAAAQREERRQQMADGQQRVSLMRRLNRAHSDALRENARREEAARRDEMRQQMAHGAQMVAQRRRINRAHDAALREEAARNRRAEAERRAAGARLVAILRQQEADFRRHTTRLAGISDTDQDLTSRFQGMNDGDLRRMSRSISSIGDAMNGVSASNARARGTASALTRDMQIMSQVLQNAARDGRLSQREFNSLSRGLTQAEHGMRALRRSGAMTREAFRDARREAALLRAQLNLLSNDGTIFNRLDSRLLIFQRRLRDTSYHGGLLRRSMINMSDGMAGGMRIALRGVAGLIGGLSRLGGMININKRWTAIIIASLLLIGPIAQALGALLVTALGGAFIALGAYALRGSTQVRSAFSEMKSTLDDVLTESAQPLEGALSEGLLEVGVAARRMQPMLTAAFSAAAPLVKDLFGGITDLFGSALPGLTTALSQSEPVMAGFRDAMKLIGDGIGDMFAAMTDNGGAEALREVWRTLGGELRNLLIGIGDFINFAAQSGTVTLLMVGFFRALSGILNIIQGSLAIVDTLFGGLFHTLADSITNTDSVIDGMEGMGDAFQNAGLDADTLKDKLAEVDKRIAKIKKDRADLDVVGPAKDYALKGTGSEEKDLKAALAERQTLLSAIKAAEEDAASATGRHATAVRDLITQIQSLANLNLGRFDSQAAQEQAIADATKKATENQGKWNQALSFTNGQLKRNGQEGRDAYEQLSNIARTTKEATDKAIEANAPWAEVIQRWKDGRESLVSMADGWGLNKEQARQLADQIIGMPPSKDIVLRARTDEAIASFNGVIAAMEAAPNAKTITVTALSQDAQTLLEDIGFTVERLPDGKIEITAENGVAIDKIGAVKGARDALKGKNITMSATDASTTVIGAIKALRDALTDKSITITTVHRTVFETIGSAPSTTADLLRQQAQNFGASGGKASSLPMKRFAKGASISGTVLQGPGTKTSDSIIARLSRGEFVMRAAAVDKYGVAAMQRINMGLLPKFASGGSAQKMREARGDLVPFLTVSRFGKFAGNKNSEFISAMTKSGDRQDLINELNKMRSSIKKSTSGGTESRLLRQLDSAGKSLLKHEKNLTSVNKSLEKAKDKLDGLKDAASQLKESVKNGIINELDITRSASGEDSNVTLNTIMSQLTADSSRAKSFQTTLSALKKRGFSGRVLEQVAQAGVNGGGLETATALMSASASQIKQINDMNQSIRDSADDAGDVAADALYAAGIKAAEGLVKGLQRQQDNIEKQMLAIAKSMEKAIKKALKIKSPSRVMEQVGHFTAEGFAVGVEKNSRPKHSWKSLLDTPSSSPAGTSYSGGRSGEPMIIQLNIGGNNIGEVIIDPLRKSIRHRGGNVQAVLGK